MTLKEICTKQALSVIMDSKATTATDIRNTFLTENTSQTTHAHFSRTVQEWRLNVDKIF
jgi:hypothetical protein